MDSTTQYPVMTELTTTKFVPERYIRINIAKTSRGYSHETTVSLRWVDDVDEYEEFRTLLRRADTLARDEIAIREAMDEHAAGGDV